jgi:hypothetical protein
LTACRRFVGGPSGNWQFFLKIVARVPMVEESRGSAVFVAGPFADQTSRFRHDRSDVPFELASTAAGRRLDPTGIVAAPAAPAASGRHRRRRHVEPGW